MLAAAASLAAPVLCGSFALGAPHGDEKADAAPPGMTYESIERLPDFSGWWYEPLDPSAGPGGLNPLLGPTMAVLKPEVAAEVQRLAKPFGGFSNPNPASLPDPVDLGAKPYYCDPLRFSGDNGPIDFEFLFTPGRVTITNEGGMIRRVFLTRLPPADVDESYMGTSVGHWESGTLVVETFGIDHDAPLQALPGLKIGKHAHSVERISLEGPDGIEIALHLDAPDIFAKPLEVSQHYRRDRGHVFHEYTNCVENDRSVDPVTGRQRFDLTPPPDLPPPPG
jgi:hypothetical protein